MKQALYLKHASIAAILLILQLCTASASAGDIGISMSSIESSGFPGITFYSTITYRGKPVKNLTRMHFDLKEDNKLITEFSIELRRDPITVALVLDSSGSVRDFIGEIKKGARLFIENLKDADRAMVIEFGDNVILSQKLTFDKRPLLSAIDDLRASGATKLYDAAYRGLEELDRRHSYLVLFTDGRDVEYSGDSRQYSDHTVKEVVSLARRKNIPIYTIGVGKEIDGNVLKKMASATGGSFFKTLDPSKISLIYKRVSELLSYHYFFNYRSPNLKRDGAWRHVRLREKKSGNEATGRFRIGSARTNVPGATGKTGSTGSGTSAGRGSRGRSIAVPGAPDIPKAPGIPQVPDIPSVKWPDPVTPDSPDFTIPESPDPVIPEPPEPSDFTMPTPPDPVIPEPPEPPDFTMPTPPDPVIPEPPEPPDFTMPTPPDPVIPEPPEPPDFTKPTPPDPVIPEPPEPPDFTIPKPPKPPDLVIPEPPDFTVPDPPEPPQWPDWPDDNTDIGIDQDDDWGDFDDEDDDGDFWDD